MTDMNGFIASSKWVHKIMKPADGIANFKKLRYLAAYLIITAGGCFEREGIHHCFCHAAGPGTSHLGANLNLRAPHQESNL